MPPTKVYKFAAAAVMTTVAAATVVTFSTAEDAGSSPAAGALPRVPGNNAAPSVGIDQTPESILSADGTTRAQASAPSSDSTQSASGSTQPSTTAPPSSTPKPGKPSPSQSPTPGKNDGLGGLLDGLFGGG